MKLYPVIMCGGAGTRLWPASRPSKPKQFIPLSGNRSLFQETALRVAPLAKGGGRLIVVAGVAHRSWVVDQLADIGLEAKILLEPIARDSAPAMAAAAAWTIRHDPDGVNAFVASDHHIPDHQAFRAAITKAAEGARRGRMVTLGVKPTEPSSAYGYIKPSGGELSEVDAFVEKPDARTAVEYIKAGYLWNSGNFICSAATLIDELNLYAPSVRAAAAASLPTMSGESRVLVLGEKFGSAPKISIDYAVMEKTHRASVLAVDFAWSDLGAWDAIATSGEGELGVHIFEDAEGCMARSAEGMVVAALGVKNLAIVAERDAVLVCSLDRAQDVKKVVERLKRVSPGHLDFDRKPVETLEAGTVRFGEWLRLKALPLWATLGQAADGGFAESLALDGRQVSSSRRARVQARQIHVYAEAGRMGWQGPWQRSVSAGLERLRGGYLRQDGLCRTLLKADGSPLDDTAMVYDQAFVLLALASAKNADLNVEDLEAQAVDIRATLQRSALDNGALAEEGAHPYQSNAHMHLLEACLAWEDAGGDDRWCEWSDSLISLARRHFVDPEGGFLREFFSADWGPASGEDGRLVEPGHQFEWAWLFARHAKRRGDADSLAVARRLYEVGRAGVSERLLVAVDAMDAEGGVRSSRARLWPQAEWIKAAIMLASSGRDGERAQMIADAALGLQSLWRYLTPDGLWRDKMMPDGKFMDEPSPASSLYHIIAAYAELDGWRKEQSADSSALGLD